MPRLFEPSTHKVGPYGKKKLSKRRMKPSTGHQTTPPFSSTVSPKAVSKRFLGHEILEDNGSSNGDTQFCDSTVPSSRKRDCTAPSPLNFKPSRQALALDTRYLVRPHGFTEIPFSPVHRFQTLTETLVRKGAAPCIIATTEVDQTTVMTSDLPVETESSELSSSPAPGISITTHNIRKSRNTLQSTINSYRGVPVVVSTKTAGSSESLTIPQKSTADYSWTLFASMIDSILAKNTTACVEDLHEPLHVTLLTTDVALFCDTEPAAHTEAVGTFVRHLQPAFNDMSLQSVRIVTATTDTMALLAADTLEKTNSFDTESKNESRQDEIQAHSAKVSVCVELIRSTLDTLSHNLHEQQVSEVSHEEPNTCNISMSVMKSTSVGYTLLSRQWIRDSFQAHQLSSQLRIDLPETKTGTQCSLSLVASHQIFPFSLNSPHANHALADLSNMSRLNFTTKHLIPLSSIDSSLIYGLPMIVQASDEGDLTQFHEMQALAQSLFRMLQDRGIAILFETMPEGKTTDNLNGRQQFVLMAREVTVGSSSIGKPTTGLLSRIVHADDFLLETTASVLESRLGDTDSDTQYYEYLHDAFMGLDCRSFNPFLCSDFSHAASTDASEKTISLQSQVREPSRDMPDVSVFDDTVGIGSIAKSS